MIPATHPPLAARILVAGEPVMRLVVGWHEDGEAMVVTPEGRAVPASTLGEVQGVGPVPPPPRGAPVSIPQPSLPLRPGGRA